MRKYSSKMFDFDECNGEPTQEMIKWLNKNPSLINVVSINSINHNEDWIVFYWFDN